MVQYPSRRYYLEVQGRHRVRLVEGWELDGYRMARVAVVTDTEPRPGTDKV